MSDERNPYAAPVSKTVSVAPPVEVDHGATIVAEPPTRRSAGEGSEWISEGWRLFKRQPAQLVALMLVTGLLYIIGVMVLQLLPLVGNLVGPMFAALLMAGMTLAIDRLYRGEGVGFELIFAGFQHPARVRLALLGLTVGLLSVLATGLAALASNMVPFWQASMGFSELDPQAMIENGSFDIMGMMLYLMYTLLLVTPVMMANWFAGMLVLLNGMQPGAALGYSFRACLRNVLPLTLFSLLLTLMALASVFTLFLGLLVLFPVFMLSWYISYRWICTQPASAVSA